MFRKILVRSLIKYEQGLLLKNFRKLKILIDYDTIEELGGQNGKSNYF